MNRFIITLVLVAACSHSGVQHSNSVAVQPVSPATGATEKLEISNSRTTAASSIPPEVLAVVNVPLPPPEISPERSWEDVYFEEIIERERVSKLRRLKFKVLPKDDLEIRVWSGFGITVLRGFLLKRNAGKWSAIHLGEVIPIEQKGRLGAKEIDKELPVPSSGWDPIWQKLLDNGILTLPSAPEAGCDSGVSDGFSYVIEYRVGGKYRAYMYDNPDAANCEEAKRMVEILKIIADEFY